jgi:hypothetical protein
MREPDVDLRVDDNAARKLRLGRFGSLRCDGEASAGGDGRSECFTS